MADYGLIKVVRDDQEQGVYSSASYLEFAGMNQFVQRENIGSKSNINLSSTLTPEFQEGTWYSSDMFTDSKDQIAKNHCNEYSC